jgi:hypothetical protein
MEARRFRRVALKRLGDLDREFARRRQHQRLRFRLRQIQPRQDRQRERSGLAGAGLRLSEHVAAGEQGRDGRGLDRRGRFVADLSQRRQHGIARPRSRNAMDSGAAAASDMGGGRSRRMSIVARRSLRAR